VDPPTPPASRRSTALSTFDFSPVKLCSDFQPPGLTDNKFVLSYATKFVIILLNLWKAIILD
jgi:hypothetical protein